MFNQLKIKFKFYLNIRFKCVVKIKFKIGFKFYLNLIFNLDV